MATNATGQAVLHYQDGAKWSSTQAVASNFAALRERCSNVSSGAQVSYISCGCSLMRCCTIYPTVSSAFVMQSSCPMAACQHVSGAKSAYMQMAGHQCGHSVCETQTLQLMNMTTCLRGNRYTLAGSHHHSASLFRIIRSWTRAASSSTATPTYKRPCTTPLPVASPLHCTISQPMRSTPRYKAPRK